MMHNVVDVREVLLTHANASRRGGIERDVRAVDVSPNNDWSMVKVWYGPNGGLGTSAYPTKGFIYSGHKSNVADLPATQIASRDTGRVSGLLTFAAPVE